MDMVKITSTESNKTVNAEVIHRSDKKLIVILEGTTIRMTMVRDSVKKPYVGSMHKMEFVSKG